MADPRVAPIHEGPGAKKGSSRGSGADMLAAGAARASGERAKRRRTPLLTDASGDEVAPRPLLSAVDVRAPSVHRPRPVPKPVPVPAVKAARSAAPQPSSERVSAKTAKPSPAT